MSRPPGGARTAQSSGTLARPGRGGPGRRGDRTTRDRRGEVAAAIPAAEPGFAARHSMKVAAVVAIAVLSLVFFPRLVNRHEPGFASSDANDGAGAGTTSASVGGAPPGGGTTLAAAGGRSGMVSVAVSTIPHGGTITIDST